MKILDGSSGHPSDLGRIPFHKQRHFLPELIKAVEDGETVTICRRGVPAVDIIRTKKPSRKRRKLGTLKGKIHIRDVDWWKPMSDDEADAFVEGRD